MPQAPGGAGPGALGPLLASALWVASMSYSFFLGLMYGTRSAIMMDVTNPKVAGTQFTAYMAMMNLAIAYSATWQGLSAEALGYPKTLFLDAGVGLLSLLLLPWIRPATGSETPDAPARKKHDSPDFDIRLRNHGAPPPGGTRVRTSDTHPVSLQHRQATPPLPPKARLSSTPPHNRQAISLHSRQFPALHLAKAAGGGIPPQVGGDALVLASLHESKLEIEIQRAPPPFGIAGMKPGDLADLVLQVAHRLEKLLLPEGFQAGTVAPDPERRGTPVEDDLECDHLPPRVPMSERLNFTAAHPRLESGERESVPSTAVAIQENAAASSTRHGGFLHERAA
jgi:hypothetical protein